jgi:hypothetical protein
LGIGFNLWKILSCDAISGRENGWRLGEEADLIVQNCLLPQMFLESTTVQ